MHLDTPDYRDHLRGPLEAALTGYARARTARNERGAEPPRPGDVFVFTATAELAVLWVVAEHDLDNDRFLAVPADSNLLTGSADVAVASQARGGALSLRCAFGVWLDAKDFADARRTGMVESETLERIRQKRAEIEAGKRTGSLIEHETDAELEYQDWIKDIKNAELRLFRQLHRRQISAFSEAGKTSFRWGRLANSLGIAASVLMVVSLGLLGGLLRQRQEIAVLENRLATEAQEIAKLQNRLATQAQVNVPIVPLHRKEAVRGPAEIVTVPAGSRSLMLMIDVDTSYPSYRLEIMRKATDTRVWSSDELTKGGVGGLTALLPLSILPPGEYQLDLYGLGDGQPQPVEDYSLSRELASSPR